MKKFFVMIALFVIALFAFGQTTDSTAVVTYNFGESLMEFLKANMWTLAFVILYFLSEWIGESETIPEGSVLRKIVNILFGLESPKMKAMKAKHQEELKAAVKPAEEKKGKSPVGKMLIIAVLLSSFTIGASAQTFGKMFKPVTVETINAVQMQKQMKGGSDTLVVSDKGVLIARFGATVLGAKTNYDKTLGSFVTEPFARSGFGVTFSNYINNEGEAFNNYGFGAYLLFPLVSDIEAQYMSVMVDVSALQLLDSFTFNIGVGYDINKDRTFGENWFISPGVKVTF